MSLTYLQSISAIAAYFRTGLKAFCTQRWSLNISSNKAKLFLAKEKRPAGLRARGCEEIHSQKQKKAHRMNECTIAHAITAISVT